MEEAGISIIGAGVVGLAIAAEVAEVCNARTVYVLEKNEAFGRETSSRNSGVIHAGIHYPSGSLKSRLCVEGNALLYMLCLAHGIAHRKTGKLIVATKVEELPRLRRIYENGIHNGVELRLLSPTEARHLEPNVSSVGALLSPSTGIVDAYGLMEYFASVARAGGVHIAYKTRVTALEKVAGGWRVTVQDSGESFSYLSRVVVNCAGLWSDKVARLAGVDVEPAGYALHYCKGQYFSLTSRPVTRIIYPVPRPTDAGLGIHATPDLEGRLRLGPDATYIRDLDYSVDESKRRSFFESVRDIIPSIDRDDLQPDFAGIRPKLQGPGDDFKDFLIAHEADRGLEGLVNLVGIESPGLTASPAIARYVRSIVQRIL